MPRQARLLNAHAKWDEKNRRWRVAVMSEGVRRQFYSSTVGTPGKREAEAKAERWLRERTSGEQMRLTETLDQWLEVVKAQTSERNYRQYEAYTRLYFKPFFAPYRAYQLTAQMLDNCLEYAYQHPVSGKSLSAKTLTNMRGALTNWLKYLRKADISRLRLEDSLTVNRNAEPRQPKRVLSYAEIRKLFSAELDNERHIHYYRLLLLTGCRPSELLAVRECDILPDRINIMHGLNPDGSLNNGKNRTAIRVIPMDERINAEIEGARAAKRKSGVISPFLFGNTAYSAMYSAWVKFLKRNGIAPTSLYELRHTNISLNKSTPDEYLKLRVGHTDSMDTRGVYSHELEDDVRQAGVYNKAAFDAVFAG